MGSRSKPIWKAFLLIGICLALVFSLNLAAFALVDKPADHISSQTSYSDLNNLNGEEPSYVPGQVIVRFKSGIEQSWIQSLLDEFGARIHRQLYKRVKKADIAGDVGTEGQASIGSEQGLSDILNESSTYLLRIPADRDLLSLVKDLNKIPLIEYAEPNYIVKTAMVPNDQYYSSTGSYGQNYYDLWGLRNINLENVWDNTQGQGVTIAVVDTGIDTSHEDIAANVWTNADEVADAVYDNDANGFNADIRGWNFINNNNNIEDDNGHGTHVAGIAAAVGNNQIGIIGVAPQAKVMAVKCLDQYGSGTTDAVAEGIRYAADNGAQVINLSLNLRLPMSESNLNWVNATFQEAINYAHDKGCVVVIAAGNDNADTACYYPSNCQNAITVGACSQQNQKTWFSNWGYRVDVAAPGGGVFCTSSEKNILSLLSANHQASFDSSAVGTNYASLAGTSMAAPYVSGMSALLKQQYPEASPDEIRGRIIATAVPLTADNTGSDTDYYNTQSIGAGLINGQGASASEPRPFFKIIGVDLTENSGDGDSIVESGEHGALNVAFENVWQSAGSVTAILSSADPRVFIGSPNGSYGSMTQGQNAGSLFDIQFSDILYQTPIELCLTVYADGNEQNLKFRIYPGSKALYRKDVSADRYWPVDDQNYISPITVDKSQLIFSDDGFKINCFNMLTNETKTLVSATDGLRMVDYDLSGSKVIWNKCASTWQGREIYLYDMDTSQLTRVTNDSYEQEYPKISGDKIIWQDKRNGGWDIYCYDIPNKTETRITPVTLPDLNALGGIKAQIYRNLIAWVDNGNICVYDLNKPKEAAITINVGKNPQNISIYNDKIAYCLSSGTNIDGVYVYCLNDKSTTCIDTTSAEYCDIKGNFVTYQRWVSPPISLQDIWLFDLFSGETTIIADDYLDQKCPTVNGSWLVWYDGRNSYNIGRTSRGIHLAHIVKTPAPEVWASLDNSTINVEWFSNDPSITEYEYAVGTSPYGGNLIPWTSAGSSSNVQVPDLNLTPGVIYYASVRAKNSAGLVSDPGYSNGVVSTAVNIPIPTVGANYADGALNANWSSTAPNVVEYSYAVGTAPGASNFVAWTSAGTNTSVAVSGISYTAGTTYYVSVKTRDSQGLWSAPGSSPGVLYSIPAAITAVNDGLGADIAFSPSANSLSANWSPSADANGIARYMYAIGTTVGGTNIVGWTSNGTAASVTKSGLTLSLNKKYYISVKAVNGIGVESAVASSNGQTTDWTAPTRIAIVSAIPKTTTTCAVSFTASSDSQSKIASYQYAVGTVSNGTDIVGWTDTNSTSQSFTITGIPVKSGTRYFVSVRAKNGAGLVGQSRSSVRVKAQ